MSHRIFFFRCWTIFLVIFTLKISTNSTERISLATASRCHHFRCAFKCCAKRHWPPPKLYWKMALDRRRTIGKLTTKAPHRQRCPKTHARPQRSKHYFYVTAAEKMLLVFHHSRTQVPSMSALSALSTVEQNMDSTAAAKSSTLV